MDTGPTIAIRVLEASDLPAAAFAAALLGDFGAEVTVIEPPGGCAIRRLGSADVQAVWWSIIGRNKSSLVLDLSSASARALLAAAVREADILLVDDSPQGRAVQEIAAGEPVRGQVTRVFAPGTDLPPLWQGSVRPEFAACASGLVALTGWADGPPVQAEFPLADTTTGLMAALLAVAELRHGRLTGERPRPVRLGLHEALLRMNEWQVSVAAIQGHAEPRNGNQFPMGWTVGNMYRTRDRRLVAVSAATAPVAERLMRLVGGESLCGDPRFSTAQARSVNMGALDAVIAQWMGRHDADDVLRLTRQADVVAGPVQDAGDILRNEQVDARADVIRVPDADGHMIAMPAPLPHIEGFPGQVRHLGPRPGEGSASIVARLGASATPPAPDAQPPSTRAAAPAQEHASGRPLAGLRVLELGLVVAGPFAGSLLAELGAEVIKIEAPGAGDPARQMGRQASGVYVWWGVASRAKKCVALDLKSQAGRQTFLSLVEQADVLVENNRPGVLERLGLGWDTLRQRNDRLVMLSISGFGGSGPYAQRPGFGKIAEAFSGVVHLTGHPEDLALVTGVSLADTSSGLMGAFGVALALLHRDVLGMGRGTRIDVALFEPLLRMCECQLALADRLGRPACREGTNDPYGWGASGRSATLWPTRCADGHWIMVDLRSLPAGLSKDRVARQVSALAVRDALAQLDAWRIEAAQVHDGVTLAATRYFASRGDVVPAPAGPIGTIPVPGEIPKRRYGDGVPLFKSVSPDQDREEVLSRAPLAAAHKG